MNAKVTYEMQKIPNPFSEERRKRGEEAWCLVEIVTPVVGSRIRGTPIALFNLDSEAERFQGHVLAEGLDGKLVSINPDLKELYERRLRTV